MMGWRDIWFERETGRLRCWWRVLAFIIIAAGSAIILYTISLFPFLQYSSDIDKAPEVIRQLYMLLTSLIIGLVSLLAGIWALRKYDLLPAITLGLPLHKRYLRTVLAGFGAGAGLIIFPCLVLWITGMASFSFRMFTLAGWSIFVFAFAVILVSAIAGELLIHGYIFQTLLRGIGPLPSLLITALFSVALTYSEKSNFLHIAAANTLVITVLLGILYLRAGSLWPSIGLIAGWMSGLFLLKQPIDGTLISEFTPLSVTFSQNEWLSDPQFGLTGGIAVSIILLAAVASIAYSRHGLPLDSRWWEWGELAPPQEKTSAWDISVGSRYYQWKLLARDNGE